MSAVRRISQRVDQVSTGDISAVTTTAPLQGGGTSGALALTLNTQSDQIVLTAQVFS